MPEVAGDAALLVDPYSIDEIADAMGRIAGDGELRRVLREKGLARAGHFTWDETARRTLAAYHATAESS